MNTLRKYFVLACLLVPFSMTFAADGEDGRHWRKVSKPILEKHCSSCHNAADKKGGIDFDDFYYIPSVVRRGDMWLKAIEMIETGEMPPPQKPRMAEHEKKALKDVVNKILDEALADPDPGASVMRRLSHREYSHTIKDLLDVDFNGQKFFPKEGSGGEGFDNSSGVLFMTPLLMERYYMAADSIIRKIQSDKKHWRQLVSTSYRPSILRRSINWIKGIFSEEVPRWAGPVSSARQVIVPFATKTYRGFLTQEEETGLIAFFDEIYFEKELWKKRDGFDQAMATIFKRILVSPAFLYRTEINQPIKKPYAISGLELATRLSYLLWSSMPDDTLIQVAYREDLHDPVVLNRETRRMMANPKFNRFAESFAPQWLGVEEAMKNPQADKELFPEFTGEVATAMRQEVIDYFKYVFNERENLLELLDSEYSMINGTLANHYGIEGIEGEEFRKVNVANYGRGGVLGMGAVLTATSLPVRTSPVLRGQWVLEQILGTPPAPPPPDVPTLEESEAADSELGLRAVLEMHRNSPACSGCHEKMDPIGFALENFDATGKWRNYYKGEVAIDAASVLPGGHEINGPAQLRRALARDKEKFAENMARKLVSYAMGRGIQFTDTPTIRAMKKSLLESNFNSKEVMLALVNSYPFRHRRSDVTDAYAKK